MPLTIERARRRILEEEENTKTLGGFPVSLANLESTYAFTCRCFSGLGDEDLIHVTDSSGDDTVECGEALDGNDLDTVYFDGGDTTSPDCEVQNPPQRFSRGRSHRGRGRLAC